MTIFYYEISFTSVCMVKLTGGKKRKISEWNERMPETLGLSLDFSSNPTTWVMTFEGQLFLAK